MKRTVIFSFGGMLAIALAGCGTGNPTVATVGNEQISLRQFEDEYAKNNGGWDAAEKAPQDERERFLNLYTNFRLKVLQARAKGLEKDSALRSEYDTYRSTIAQSYVTEKELLSPNIQRAYDRRNTELRASHILFRVTPTAPPKDTLAAYEKAMHVISLIPKISFDTLARTYSEDPTVSNNGGDLGYFTGGRMVAEFEDACFGLKPGEYTKKPVRTQYGYHVVKVFDRQPNAGAVHISHVQFRFAPDLKDTSAIQDTAWMVYSKIMNGMPFAEAAAKYSMDPGSAARGGDIGSYERGSLPLVLRELLFETPIDSVTKPVRFSYGFHIFKILDRKGMPPFAEMEKQIKETYQQQRYAYDYKIYVAGLRARTKPSVDSSVLVDVASAFDTTMTITHPAWMDTVSQNLRARVLVRLGQDQWSVQKTLERVAALRDVQSLPLTPANVELMIDKAVDQMVVDHHALSVCDTYPEFVKLMKEYEDGILLFRIEQDEVWEKVVSNDSLLREYYEKTKENYRWPDRINVAEIHVATDSAAKACYAKIRKGADFLEVAADNTNRPGMRERKGVLGFQSLTANEVTKKAATMATDSVSAPYKDAVGWSIIKVIGRDSARVKTYDEALPEVSSAYQEFASSKRQREWTEELKQRFPVTINAEALKDAFKNKRD